MQVVTARSVRWRRLENLQAVQVVQSCAGLIQPRVNASGEVEADTEAMHAHPNALMGGGE